MARKTFEELTAFEKYRRLKKQGYTFMALKWIAIVLPYIIIGIVNFDKYFVKSNGWKMSIGCVLALTVAFIAIKNEAKKNQKFSGVVGWFIALVLVFLFQSILNDLLLIVGCGFIGQLVGAGFAIGESMQLEKAALYYKANVNAETTVEVFNREV